jgi:hypothetical protein
MGRHKAVISGVRKTIWIDEDLAGQVDLLLWSELEQKVPYGAWKEYLQELIKKDLKGRKPNGNI